MSFTSTDLASIAGIMVIAVGALKFIVRSDVRSELKTELEQMRNSIDSMRNSMASIPEQIHEQVEQHVSPIERRQRITENLSAHLYGLLTAKNLVDPGEYEAVKRRFVEDSASYADKVFHHQVAHPHTEGAR
jgi:hypothetical protein